MIFQRHVAEKAACLFAFLGGELVVRMPKILLTGAMAKLNRALYESGIYGRVEYERIRYGLTLEDQEAARELLKYLLMVCSNMTLYEK